MARVIRQEAPATVVKHRYQVTWTVEVDATDKKQAREFAIVERNNCSGFVKLIPATTIPRHEMNMEQELATYGQDLLYRSPDKQARAATNFRTSRMLSTKWAELRGLFHATQDGRERLARCVQEVWLVRGTCWCWVRTSLQVPTRG